MVSPEDIYNPVEVGRFPGMVCKIACGIDRSPITPADHILVAKAEFLKIQRKSLFILCLREFFYLCDNPVGVAITYEITFPDKPVVFYIEMVQCYGKPVKAAGDFPPELLYSSRIAMFNELHQGVYLLGYCRVFL